MNHLYITLEEAEKVVAKLKKVHAKGFVASQAVLKMYGKVDSYGWVAVKYSHMCDKAHPTDGMQNWGCQYVSEHFHCIDGKLVADIIEKS